MAGTSAAILALVITAAIVINSGALDLFAKKQIVSLFNNEFRGRLEIRAVHLHFPDGVVIEAPRILEEGELEPAIAADRITLNFNFLSLLKPRITSLSFKECLVDGFRGRIIGQKSGRFNLQDIFTRRNPDKPEVLAIGKFRSRILRVRNGSLLYAPLNAPSYDLRSLTVDISKVFVAKYEFMGSIERLQFTIPDRGFTLRKGTAMVAFSSVRSEVIGLDLETAKSRARLSVSMDGLDLFSDEGRKSVSNSPAFLHIESILLSTDDLNRIYPVPALPEGSYMISGDAKGTLRDLQIMPSTIEHNDSRLAFKGELLNTLDRKNLSFRLQFDKSKISAGLLEKLLVDDRQKQLARDSGGIEFSGLLQGRPTNVLTDISFTTRLGSGSVAINTAKISSGRYQADGTFAIEKLQPHRLLGIEGMKSGFSGSGTIQGVFDSKRGVESGHMEAAVMNAFWQNQQASSGSMILDFKERKLDASVDLKDGDVSGIIMAGTVDFSAQTPAYELGGSVKGVDLSKATASAEFATNLNGTFDVRGEGFDPASLNMSAHMLFAPSSIDSYKIRDQTAISAAIVQSPGSSTITFKSDFMDLALQGSASLSEVMGTVRMAAASISRELGFSSTAPGGFTASPFEFSFKTTVRDLEPLRPFLPFRDIQMQGTSEGKASWSGGQLTLDGITGIDRFRYGSMLRLDNMGMTTTLKCSTTGVSSASLSGTASSLIIAGKELKNMRVLSSFDKGVLDTSMDLADTQFDQTLSASFRAQRTGSMGTLTVNRLALSSPEGVWQATPGSTIDFASTFVRFNRFRFGKQNQSIVFDGMLSSTLPGTFQGTMSNVELSEMKRFFLDPSLDQLSGQANARISVSGRPGEKTSELDFRGSDVVFNDISIGELHLTANHSGEHLLFNLESHVPNQSKETARTASVNTIKGSGSIPLILNFSPFQVRIPENRPLDASLRSDDLSAKFLVYVVPFFSEAEGIIPTNLRITGTMPRPDIYLTTSLNDTRIRIAPTEVPYQVTGEVKGSPSRIEISNMKFRDSLQGTGSISGLVRLEGLKPTSLELTGNCRRLLLYNKKDKKDDTSYGTITGTSNDLRLSGELTAPTAEGELMLTSADFFLYRKGSNESAKYIGVEKFIEFVPRHPAPAPPAGLETAAPTVSPQFHFNLIDILQIRNLRLTCNVPLRGTMIFDRIRGERIEASVNNLSLSVNKFQQQFSLLGSVDIIGGKYTFSNSNFDLENGGRITWNNDEIRNGHLNNVYGGKQISAYDAQSGERDNVKLLIAVSGTIDTPNVRMGYFLNDDSVPYSSVNMIGSQTSHVDANADLNVISMLLSRQWYIPPDRQSRSGNLPVSSVGVSAGTGLLSSQISNIVQGIAGLESFNINVGTDSNGTLSGLELYYALLIPGTSGKVRFIGTSSTPTVRNNTVQNYYGSSQKIEYRINPKVYIEAFRSYGQTGGGSIYSNLEKPTENWGVSMSYRERFHTWNQFWNHIIGRKEKKEKP
jgi:hypothetical protein